jgi:peptidoglycan hydrolase CwlO-like protein
MLYFRCLILAFFLCSLVLFPLTQLVSADEVATLAQKIAELSRNLEETKKNTVKNEHQLDKLNQELLVIKNAVLRIESEIDRKSKDIKKGEDRIIVQKEKIEARVKSFYKQSSRLRNSILEIVVSPNFTKFIKQYSYSQNLLNEDREEIVRVALLVSDIETKKKELEDERLRLIPVKEEINKQTTTLQSEVVKSKEYEANIKKEIAALSARQQEIISSRSGGFTANLGDTELADDYNASLRGFRESAPSGYFAVFSFGAYTHRKGMSQYGARGRAHSGQSYKQILNAYYNKEPISKDTSGTIKVAEHGEIDFETTYMYGISEMPASWHPEALKAQAIASRTFALRYKALGREICITERCQVFRKSKSDAPPEAWRAAVDSTRGEVLDAEVAFYSSTSGGFLTTSGWDTSDKNGGSDFISRSYEKVVGSPWLYKSWYTQSYSINSDKCGRQNPWLSPEEMADIVNAALVLAAGSSQEVERVSPVTTQCYSGNPYSMTELREVAKKYGGIDLANSVNVLLGDGTTKTITINGVSLSGVDFKKAFNLRAPGRLSIPQRSFSFYNIEKK